MLIIWSFPGGTSGKEPTCQCKRQGFDSWVGEIPWRRKWQSTSVFLPGKFHGQRRLVGYSPWGHQAFDMSEQLSTHVHYLSKKYNLLKSKYFLVRTSCIILISYEAVKDGRQFCGCFARKY